MLRVLKESKGFVGLLAVGIVCICLSLTLVLVSLKSYQSLTQTPTVAGQDDNPQIQPPVASTTEVNVIADVIKFLNQTQDIPLQAAVTPTPTYVPLPALYTELSTKGLIANITNTSVTIVWSTAAPQPTNFKYGATETLITRKLEDDRGKVVGYLHFVTLKNLTKQATYYFTGPSPITDSVTLPPTLPEPTTKTTISGTLSGVQGECIVKATVLRDAKASTSIAVPVTKDAWKLELQAVRDSGLSTYMNPLPTDTVKLDALCFGKGNAVYAGTQAVLLQQAQNQETLLVVKKQN